MKFVFTFSGQNITFKFFIAMSQNLVKREFAFRANKKLSSQCFSTLLFLPVVSINKERIHFFPPELKKFQQTEEWSQFEKNNFTTGWCNAYKYCPIRQGLSGLSGLVKQLKLTCSAPWAHKTKTLGTQYNPRRLDFKGTSFNLLLKVVPHICMCFTWQRCWLRGLVSLSGLASAQHLLLMDIGSKCAKVRLWCMCKSWSLVHRIMRQLQGKEEVKSRVSTPEKKRTVSLGLNSHHI